MILFPVFMCLLLGAIIFGVVNVGWMYENVAGSTAMVQKDYYYLLYASLSMYIAGLWLITVDRKIKTLAAVMKGPTPASVFDEWKAKSHNFVQQTMVNYFCFFLLAACFAYLIYVNQMDIAAWLLPLIGLGVVAFFFLGLWDYSIKYRDVHNKEVFAKFARGTIIRDIVAGGFLLLCVALMLGTVVNQTYITNRFQEMCLSLGFAAVSLVYYNFRGPTTNQIGDSTLVTCVMCIVVVILRQFVQYDWFIADPNLAYSLPSAIVV